MKSRYDTDSELALRTSTQPSHSWHVTGFVWGFKNGWKTMPMSKCNLQSILVASDRKLRHLAVVEAEETNDRGYLSAYWAVISAKKWYWRSVNFRWFREDFNHPWTFISSPKTDPLSCGPTFSVDLIYCKYAKTEHLLL